MGAVTPLGESVEDFWNGLIEGKSGITPITLCDASSFTCQIAGEVSGFDAGKYINLKESRRMARFSQLAVAAAQLSLEDSKLNLSKENVESIGVVIGNGNGGFPTTEENANILFTKGGMKVSPFFIPMILPNMAASNISRILGTKGYSNTIITACAAGTQAIGEATEVIRRGTSDVIFAGGCEAGISPLGLGGFCVIHALTSRNSTPQKASRPFDAHRDGFIPAEGAAVLVLESLEHALNRGANILAEILGYSASSDGYHLVQPEKDGAGASRAIKWSLKDAGLEPTQIDYINAHGTSTPLNDTSETLAIKKALGAQAYKIPISSTKSMIGHALGGAGAIESVACIKTIQNGIMHPTVNYENPDPTCDLDYIPNKSRLKDVKTVLSNSFGFGGQNACVIFGEFQD
jgi:3-oxoacyl-[acyl-carrier-protein] synthase II